jgi:hypothetical protein
MGPPDGTIDAEMLSSPKVLSRLGKGNRGLGSGELKSLLMSEHSP